MIEVPAVSRIVDLPVSVVRNTTIAVSPEDKDSINGGQKQWNNVKLAMIPYCMQCAVPVNIVLEDPEALLRCPGCGTVWIRDEDKRWNNIPPLKEEN